MDFVAKLQDIELPMVIEPTRNAFVPLLEAKRSVLETVPKKTFQFGPLERNQLDVYYPTRSHDSGKTPVLFYFYGGGLTTGSRVLPAPFSLVYTNLANFFTERGYLTIIPDYRLVPEIRFPQPAEDVGNAITWVVQHPQEVCPTADFDNVFVMGHSAGGIHVMTSVLHPGLLGPGVVSKIRGLIPSGTPFHLTGSPAHRVGIFQYYENEEGIATNQPSSLLKRASDDVVKHLPEILISEAEREPDRIGKSIEKFHKELEQRLGKKVDRYVAVGHNHISMSHSLSTGEGEQWAEQVVEWINSKFQT